MRLVFFFFFKLFRSIEGLETGDRESKTDDGSKSEKRAAMAGGTSRRNRNTLIAAMCSRNRVVGVWYKNICAQSQNFVIRSRI